VEYLLLHDAIIDKPNNLGWTSLMHAARNGHPSTVNTLLNYGANVQLTNGMGNFLFVINAGIYIYIYIYIQGI
jgi:ankyrin repeat protein